MKLLISLIFALATLLASAQSPALNVFIWSEYIDPEIVTEFEKANQCKVTLDLYEDSESMLAKIQNGGTALYDVAVVTDNMVPAMTKQCLLAPLRHENLPNLTNLEPRFLNPTYDPGNKYTAAYQWGTIGILYRKQAGKPPIDSWGALFDPQRQSGPFLLMDSMRDTIGAALKFKGYSVNSVVPAQMREVRDLLLAAKNRSVGFDGSVGVKNKILGKTARMGIVYSGEGLRAVMENPDLVYVVPKEGSMVWVDSLVVLAKAPQRNLGEKFINYLLDPKVGVRISKYTQFSTPNQEAKKLLSPAELANEALYPSPETMRRLEFLQDPGPKSRLYDEVWTQVKAR